MLLLLFLMLFLTLTSLVAHNDVQERYVELVSYASFREVSSILQDHHVVDHDDVQLNSHVDPLAIRLILVELDIVTNIEAQPLEVFTVFQSFVATSGSLIS